MFCSIISFLTILNFGSAISGPVLTDENLEIEILVQGLDHPTSMAFLAPDEILILEKNNGKVRRIVNNTLLPEPVIDLQVANARERGLLGIAIAKSPNTYYDDKDTKNGIDYTRENKGIIDYVFLYFTKGESKTDDGGDFCVRSNMCEESEHANFLYRYEFKDGKLVKPKLLLKIPSFPGAVHNGGAIALGPHDNNLYILTGDGDSCALRSCHANFEKSVLNSMRSNFNLGVAPDGRGGILRVSPYGEDEKKQGLLGDTSPVNKYFAYGIRNGFGLEFDPVTGILWDTENGSGFGDEINLVRPGFNSGWAKVQGVWEVSSSSSTGLSSDKWYKGNKFTNSSERDSLVNFGGKGEYSAPEFVWDAEVAPTALAFYDSDKIGERYKNDLFVADFLNGNIYHLELDKTRTSFLFSGTLSDKIANSTTELNDLIFAQGFGNKTHTGGIGGITDIEVGPYDGYIYVLSHTEGKLFRIIPMLDSDHE